MKNKIVDSHCHLNFDDFKDDLDNVIQNAKEKDVDYMLSISVNLESPPNKVNILGFDFLFIFIIPIITLPYFCSNSHIFFSVCFALINFVSSAYIPVKKGTISLS